MRVGNGTGVVLTQKCTAFSPNTLCQLMGQLYKSAVLDWATSRSGSRWFITRLAHSVVSPKVIMDTRGRAQLDDYPRYIDVRDKMMKPPSICCRGIVV
ncbi:MAG TPA: hypothetical protein VD840_09945 [Sinorhizobium sp.]|nr:hypothetical protein [Sinorhizobium sp.]